MVNQGEGGVVVPHLHAAPHGLAVRPVAAGQGAADHQGGSRRFDVLVAQRAPGEDRDAEGREVAGADRVDLEGHQAGAAGVLDGEEGERGAVRDHVGPAERHRGDPRQPLEPPEEVAGQAVDRRVLVPLRAAEVEAQGGDVVGAHPKVERPEVLEAEDHQPVAEQQDQGEGDLGDHQGALGSAGVPARPRRSAPGP